jgi:hypothetical protein
LKQTHSGRLIVADAAYYEAERKLVALRHEAQVYADHAAGRFRAYRQRIKAAEADLAKERDRIMGEPKAAPPVPVTETPDTVQ